MKGGFQVPMVSGAMTKALRHSFNLETQAGIYFRSSEAICLAFPLLSIIVAFNLQALTYGAFSPSRFLTLFSPDRRPAPIHHP